MMKKTFKVTIIALAISIVAALAGWLVWPRSEAQEHKTYTEKRVVTPNIGKGTNEVKGIVLHHTAEPTVESSLAKLCDKEKEVSSHVVIDTDGSRYILAEPTQITWHAGYSELNGREKCNDFTIGVEFQGNTLERPLTEDQIKSGIEYIRPLMAKYNIPIENIVTHEMVRTAWIEHHPDLAKQKGVYGKVDITQKEYKRFIEALKAP